MTTSFLEALTGSRVKARLLQCLYVEAPTAGTLSEADLVRASGVPSGSIHKALMQLVEAQLVVREEMRRGPEYRAPFEDPRLKGLFLMLRQDTEIVAALKQALRKTKHVSYACIFGSFAAGTTHKGSDIDVLIIEQAGLDRFEFQITLGRVAERFGRPVNPEFYSAEEFSRKLASLDPVVLSILDNPRIELKGATPWQT